LAALPPSIAPVSASYRQRRFLGEVHDSRIDAAVTFGWNRGPNSGVKSCWFSRR
jgi:hypothetical protein